MTEAPEGGEKKKRERSIRSETTRVFLVVFGILIMVGFFNILSNIRGMNTFRTVEKTYLVQYQAAENMGKKANDIIALSYLLAGDHDLTLLMAEMLKYDGMVQSFESSKESFKNFVKEGDEQQAIKLLVVLEKIENIFVDFNNSCRDMTISIMEGDKQRSRVAFTRLDKQIDEFRNQIKILLSSVNTNLRQATAEARDGLFYTSILGAVVIFLAVFITLGLIYYLMSFLSISLLPISNLMHNLRQAVFSIDKAQNVVYPVSAYSSTVFGTDIVGRNVVDTVYKDVPTNSETMASLKSALSLVFGEDEIQWLAMEDCFPQMVEFIMEEKDQILKITYTPLLDKDENVQSIMMVAEDVTEIEKLRMEAKKKQGEVAILQSLVNMDSQDLTAFLEGTNNLLKNAIEQFDALDKDPKAGEILFRNLHTIKGNSRMHALTVLSETTHIAENALDVVNKKIAAGKPVDQNSLLELRRHLFLVEVSLATHSQIAARFLGADDNMHETVWRRFIFSIGMLEYLSTSERWVNEHKIEEEGSDGSKWRIFVGSGEDTVQEAQILSEFLGMEVLHKELAKVKFGDEECVPLIKDCSEHFLKDYLKFAAVKKFEDDYDEWIEVFKRLLMTAQTLLTEGSWQNSQAQLKQSMIAILNIIGGKHLSYLHILIVRALDFLENSDEAGFKSGIKNLWLYCIQVIYVDSTFHIEEKNRKKVRSVMITDYDSGNKAWEEMTSLSKHRSFLTAFLGSVARSGEVPVKALASISGILDIALEADDKSQASLVGCLLGASSTEDLLGELDLLLASDDDALPIIFQLSRAVPGRTIFSVEIKRQIDTLTNRIGSVDEDEAEQTLEVSLEKIETIKILANKLASPEGTDSHAEKLSRIVASTFDFPLKGLFKNVQSIINDMAKALNKKVKMEIIGDDVGLERQVAHQLRDALVHMARNTMDHGIEPPEERLESGKEEEGVMRLECYFDGDNLCKILISDDGRGINCEKVIKKAVEKGVIGADAAAALNQKARVNLIFLSGLSTKENVSTFSGRGVGMDAVKSTIEELGGSVEVESELGKGARFEIIVPTHKVSELPSQKAG